MKTFLFTYYFEKDKYQLDIKAESEDEARRRVKSIQMFCEYTGELKATIPVGPEWFWKWFFK